MMKQILTVVLATVTLLVSCGTKPPAATKEKRYLHTPNMQQLVMRVINKETFLGYDSLYTAHVSKPSFFYSDFFGIQAINTLSKETIQADFVPAHATVMRNDSNQLELRFKEGYNAIFYVNTDLNVAGQVVKTDHVFFNDSTWQLFTAHLDAFRELVKKLNLEKKYFIPNPYYPQEVKTYERLQANPPHVPVTTDSSGAAFTAAPEAIYIYQDPVHGDSLWFAELHQFLRTANYDWVGIEMADVDLQNDINVFLAAAENSPEFKAVRQRLAEHYQKAWKIKGRYPADADGPWIQLFTTLKRRGKSIYALETSDVKYILFRFGETDFGAMVRNYLWASRIPATGKGIVFGGSAHFNSPRPANFQDFASERNKNWHFFSKKQFEFRK